MHFPVAPSKAIKTAPWLTSVISGVLEFAGGLLITFGVLTRPIAFFLAGEMAVTYWTVHAPRGGCPVFNGGEPAILFCFIFLYLAAAGGAAWNYDALDTLLRPKARRRPVPRLRRAKVAGGLKARSSRRRPQG